MEEIRRARKTSGDGGGIGTGTALEDAQTVEILIDIPKQFGQPHPFITMGKKTFYDGIKYTVSPEEARELRWHMEQIARHDSMVRDGGSYRSEKTEKRKNAILGKRDRS